MDHDRVDFALKRPSNLLRHATNCKQLLPMNTLYVDSEAATQKNTSL